jgi:hypothetical protein
MTSKPRQVREHLRGVAHKGELMDSTKSSAPAHPSTEDHDAAVEAHYACLERLHACYEGVVYIGHLVEDPGTGEEVEAIEAVPCRRCADSR